MSRYFHTTDAASDVMRDGFLDATGSYGMGRTLTGVFIADEIVDTNDGARGESVIELEIPDDEDLGPFEIVEDLKGYREWCVPAAMLNDPATRLRRLSQDEIDEIELEQASSAVMTSGSMTRSAASVLLRVG